MTATSRRAPRDVLLLAGLLATSGVLHFAVPAPFVRIVPRRLPYKKLLVQVSGAAELACAGALVTPALRRAGGVSTAALLLAVFPANVQMSVDAWHHGSRTARALTLLRLPLQAPLIRTAWRAGRDRA